MNDQQLGATVTEAMRLRDRQRAAGATTAELDAALEQTLRAAWPRDREGPWKYLCQDCRDYGLRMEACPGDATCGRPRRHLAHEFGRPCWCGKGKPFRDKPAPSEDDAVTAAAKVAKPMTRWGR